jgi:hypothetical protein
MVSERINEPSHAPTIRLIINGPDDRSSRPDGPLESGVRIVDDHYHSDRTAAKRLRAEIEMFRRLVRDPESGPAYGQLRDYRSSFAVYAKQYLGPKGCCVELDRPHSVSN